MITHNIDQKTDEWHEVKKGKMSASHAQAIGSCGKWLETYIIELMSEYYSSWDRENFTNAHIDRGNELEPLARWMYELETGNKVAEVWFIEYDDYVWCSPDGLVGDDWLLEIKSQSDKVHFELLLDGKIDTKYIRQMQMQMLVTGRQRCDFVSYNPNYERSLWIKRIYADPEAHEKLKKWFEIWKSQILEITKKLWH